MPPVTSQPRSSPPGAAAPRTPARHPRRRTGAAARGRPGAEPVARARPDRGPGRCSPGHRSSSGRVAPVRAPEGRRRSAGGAAVRPERHRRGGRRRTVAGSRRVSGVGENRWARKSAAGWAMQGRRTGCSGRRPGSRRRPAAGVPGPMGSRCGRSWPTWPGWDGVLCAKSCTPPVPTWVPRWPRPSGRTSARWTRAPRWCRSPGGRTTTSTCRPAWRRGWPSPAAAHEVVGVAAFQHREFGLADCSRRDRTRRPVGAAPGQRGDASTCPAGRTPRCAPAWLCHLPRRRRRGAGGAAAAWRRGHGMHRR